MLSFLTSGSDPFREMIRRNKRNKDSFGYYWINDNLVLVLMCYVQSRRRVNEFISIKMNNNS